MNALVTKALGAIATKVVQEAIIQVIERDPVRRATLRKQATMANHFARRP